MEIFNEFIVVDEKAFTDLKIEIGHQNNLTFKDVTQFAALEFRIDSDNRNQLEVRDIGNASESDDGTVPLAQIICWKWTEKGEQVIIKSKILGMGGKLKFECNAHFTSFVIRIFKERKKTDQNPCSSLCLSDYDLTVKIGENQVIVSAAWLMFISPMVQRMLSVEMREKQQRMLILDELDITMEQFMEFVEAISPIAFQIPILPNPQNVLMLLQLADYFQVDFLKSRCEAHLINCVEISLFRRVHLIEQYGLTKLKNCILRLNSVPMRDFFRMNCELLLPLISKELLVELTRRFCE